MTFTWNWLALLGLSALVLGWTMAALVYFVNPARAQNRWLALLCLVASTYAAFVSAGRLLFSDPNVARGFYTAGVTAGLMSIPIYVRFLSTLATPWANVLRHPATFAGTWILVAALVVTILFVPGQGPGEGEYHEGVGASSFRIPSWSVPPTLALFFVSIAVAVLAYRRASPGLRKRQAAYYLAAFCTHDFAFLTIASLRLFILPGHPEAALRAAIIGYPVSSLLFTLLLGYGLLKVHLFDIDLRIKQGVGRTVALAAIAVAFFVVSESAERILPFEGWIPGLLAAGLVALVFLPLQRGTVRVLDRWMPASRDTPEYRAKRKAEVYRAAYEEMAQGGMTNAERRAIDALRNKLGIAPAEAQALERAVARAGAS